MKRKHNIVFVTTVFPSVTNFINDFFQSLINQSVKEFDVLVANDGLIGFEHLIDKFEGLLVNIINVKGSPSENRMTLINEAIRMGYEYIVFGDSDDFFAHNRIETIINKISENGIVINDLSLVGNKIENNILSKNITSGKLGFCKFIDGNIAGLSNTAVRSNLFSKEIEINENIIAVDWALFSKLMLLNGIEPYFTDCTTTYYRQYQGNIAGINMDVNIDIVLNNLNIKKRHYQEMVYFCKNYHFNYYLDIFTLKLKEMYDIEKRLNDKSFVNDYISNVRSNKSVFGGWWYEIISFEKFKKLK